MINSSRNKLTLKINVKDYWPRRSLSRIVYKKGVLKNFAKLKKKIASGLKR